MNQVNNYSFIEQKILTIFSELQAGTELDNAKTSTKYFMKTVAAFKELCQILNQSNDIFLLKESLSMQKLLQISLKRIDSSQTQYILALDMLIESYENNTETADKLQKNLNAQKIESNSFKLFCLKAFYFLRKTENNIALGLSKSFLEFSKEKHVKRTKNEWEELMKSLNRIEKYVASEKQTQRRMKH